MYNRNDLFVGRSLDLYGEWCEAEIDLLGQIIKEGDVIVDVGAFIGTHSIFFANQVANGGYVYAIEPQRTSFNMLCGNIALNGLLNVKAVYAAAGSESGVIAVPVLDPNTKQNFGAVRLEKYNQGDLVGKMALDDMKLKRCNLIKIDVEGMEIQVLQGARRVIESLHPVLFVENNRLENSKEVISFITQMHYKCWWHVAPYFNEENYFKNKKNVFAQFQPEVNMLCLHSSNHIKVEDLESVLGKDDNWQKVIGRITAKQK